MFVPLLDGTGGVIGDDTVTVLASVVAAHAALAREAGASRVQAVATAAIRRVRTSRSPAPTRSATRSLVVFEPMSMHALRKRCHHLCR